MLLYRSGCSSGKIANSDTSQTRMVFRKLTNLGMEVLDFEKFSKLAASNGLPLIIDNTFPTPVLCQPFKYGANIIIHSTTKFIEGHATSLGGLIVDGGNFNWANGKFPEFTEPNASYHGVSFFNQFKEVTLLPKRAQLLATLPFYGPSLLP
jgi:O-acetylhomoserine (thiol)-lyase